MNPVLIEIFKSKSVNIGKGDIKIIDNIEPAEGLFLQELVRELKPRISLEVGLAFGVSALFICDALVAAGGEKHIAIDPFQNGVVYKGAGLANLKKGGFENIVQFHEKPSYLVLAELVAKNEKIDFAFIDGNHVFDFALLDFFYVDLLLNTGGIVVFDDADFEAVHKLCRYVLTNRSYEVYRCLGESSDKQSIRDKIIHKISSNSYTLKTHLKPEVTNPDRLIGLNNSRCVAMIKIADDNRPWDFHAEF